MAVSNWPKPISQTNLCVPSCPLWSMVPRFLRASASPWWISLSRRRPRMKPPTRSKRKKHGKSRHTAPKPSPEPMGRFNLVERRLDGRKFIEFPQMKGRTLEKIELFTAPEYHSIDLSFADGTGLALKLEPCFALHATFSDPEKEDQEIGEEWLPVHSATNPR